MDYKANGIEFGEALNQYSRLVKKCRGYENMLLVELRENTEGGGFSFRYMFDQASELDQPAILLPGFQYFNNEFDTTAQAYACLKVATYALRYAFEEAGPCGQGQ